MRTVLIGSGLAMLLAVLGNKISLAQGEVSPPEHALADYVKEGLQKNILLQQKNISLEKALNALKIAKSMYLPVVSFQGAYQTADGGRSIPLPLGDLLNGAYATLNALTASQRFPQLENQSITFLPQNFYDAKLRTTIPLLNTDIGYNKKIHEQQMELQESDIAVYRRELVKNIKAAYYDYLMSVQAVAIYESALLLAQEGKRVNEKLLENGKGLPAYVLRAESEVQQVGAQISQARQQAENAGLYFNMLLNREKDAIIDTAHPTGTALQEAHRRWQQQPEIANREEIKALAGVRMLNETILKMNRHYYVPKLNGFLDLGSQSENFQFNSFSRYYMAGLQLEMPIFTGNRNKYKIRQASLDLENSRLQEELALRQLELSADVAHNELEAVWLIWQSSLKQLEAAETYQRLIEKGYRAGTHTYIETVDARSQLMMARLSSTVNKYKVLQADAKLERETGAFDLK